MKPMNFLKTLGSVDERYVEEMLEAKEHGAVTRHIRFDPMAAVGVLSGAAVCAAMIFGIMTLKNQGETLKPKDVGASEESIAETAETTTAAVAEVDMPARNAEQQGEDSPLFEYRIIPESVTAEGLRIFIAPLAPTTDEYKFHITIWDRNGNFLTKSISADLGVNINPTDNISATNRLTIGFRWADLKGSLNPLTIEPGAYYLDITAIKTVPDSQVAAEDPPEGRTVRLPFTYGAESLEVTTQPTTAETDTADTATTVTTVTLVMTDTKPEDVIHWPSDPVVDGTTTPTPEQFQVGTTFKPEDQGAYIIAEFREAGGNPPKRVSDEESAEMNRLLEALTIIEMPNSVAAEKLDGFVGGGYVIYAGDNRCVLYNETMIRMDNTYYAITRGGEDLLDYVIAMVTKYQP